MRKNYPLLFIVEDNLAYSKIIEHHLKKNGFANVLPFSTGEDCLKHIYLKPDIIIQDYKLQGISGLNVLQLFKKRLPACEFIFLSGQDNIDIAINTVKFGAFDYIIKNDTAFERLIIKIDNIIDLQKLKRKNRMYRMILYIFLVSICILLGLLILTSDIFLF
jgi:DNA-binding NtrC family response regulator